MDNTDPDKFIEEFEDKLRSYEGFRGDKYKESSEQESSLREASLQFLPDPDLVRGNVAIGEAFRPAQPAYLIGRR